MTKYTFVLSIVLLGLNLNINAQGLNNEQYSFDQSDSENIQKHFFQIETFKFFVNAKTNENLDIVIEEYTNKKLSKTTRAISELINAFGVNPINSKFGKDDFIRMYVKNNSKKENKIELRINYLNTTYPKYFEDLDLKLIQSRAFNDIPKNIETKTPVLVIYGNKGGNFISCPADATPEEIVEIYDWVSVIYLTKIEEEK